MDSCTAIVCIYIYPSTYLLTYLLSTTCSNIAIGKLYIWPNLISLIIYSPLSFNYPFIYSSHTIISTYIGYNFPLQSMYTYYPRTKSYMYGKSLHICTVYVSIWIIFWHLRQEACQTKSEIGPRLHLHFEGTTLRYIDPSFKPKFIWCSLAEKWTIELSGQWEWTSMQYVRPSRHKHDTY